MKKRFTKKFLAVVLALALLLISMPLSSVMTTAATLGTCGDNLVWDYNTSTNTLTISGTGAMYEYGFRRGNGIYYDNLYNNAPWKDYCNNIKNIVIEEGLTYISYHAFRQCWPITNVRLPSTLVSVGSCCFENCNSLNRVNFGGTIENWCKIDFGNTTSNPMMCGHHLYIDNTEVTDLVIPNSITEIKNNAFCGGSGLTSITIPNSVIKLGDNAFDSCVSLSYVEIPSSVVSIGTNCFINSSVTDVKINNGLTSIGVNAFYGCNNLQKISIPKSLTSIGNDAFYNCSNLQTVYFAGTKTDRTFTLGTGNEPLTNATWYYEHPTHIYDNACDTTCNVCGEVRVAPHDYIVMAQEDATCTTGGYVIYICTGCSDSYFDEIPAYHTYEYSCSEKCSSCGEERAVTHTYDNACDTTCNICGKVRITTTHIYDNCCDDTCNICGEKRTAPHNYSVLYSKTPTCTTTGYKYYKCSVCNKGYMDNLPATHNYEETVVPPTETEQGYTRHTCSTCGDTYDDTFVPSTGVAEKIAEKGEELLNTYLRTAVQTKKGATALDETYEIRLISMVDCLGDYNEVGFEIVIEGLNDGVDDDAIVYSTDTVYTSLINGSTKINASDYGCEFFTIVTMSLTNEFYDSNITIKPYIMFTDGTVFYGNAVNTSVGAIA